MGWPREVPILTGKDIIRGSVNSSDGKKHCLVGWMYVAFGRTNGGGCDDTVWRQLLREINAARHPRKTKVKWSSVAVFNDRAHVSRAFIAKIWNRAMYKLGYTVGNPKSAR